MLKNYIITIRLHYKNKSNIGVCLLFPDVWASDLACLSCKRCDKFCVSVLPQPRAIRRRVYLPRAHRPEGLSREL